MRKLVSIVLVLGLLFGGAAVVAPQNTEPAEAASCYRTYQNYGYFAWAQTTSYWGTCRSYFVIRCSNGSLLSKTYTAYIGSTRYAGLQCPAGYIVWLYNVPA